MGPRNNLEVERKIKQQELKDRGRENKRIKGFIGSIQKVKKDRRNQTGIEGNSLYIIKEDIAPVTAPLVFIQTFVNAEPVLAMLDSGAIMCIIGEKLANQLGLKSISLPTWSVRGWGGSRKVERWVRLKIRLLNNHICHIVAAVSSEFDLLLLLGSPFFYTVRGIIDFNRNLMSTRYGSIPLISKNQIAQVSLIAPRKDKQLSSEDKEKLTEALEGSRLNIDQRESLENLLYEFSDLWAGDVRGVTDVLECKLRVIKNKFIRHKPRRWSSEQARVIEDEVKKMEKAGIIQLSNSPFVQEPVLVRKGKDSWRFCVDFRKLNQITEPDQFPLPRIHELIRHIRDSSYFISIDLRSGYWQIPMEKNSIKYTAFRAHHRLYEYLVMPFGLKTAPATFCRLMQLVLGDLYWDGVCVYLDDLLIHHVTFEGCLELLKKVFNRLREAHLTLAFNKCKFCPESLTYLGYVIEKGIIKPNIKRVEPWQKLKTPKSVRDVRALLGGIGYFRIFISNYAQISLPLTQLLQKNVKFEWTERCEEAKNMLIKGLSEATLSNPLIGDNFQIETDASNTTIAGVLSCQSKEGELWRPVEFISKTLNKVQQRWPTHEREAYAVVYSIEKWDQYLRGRKFNVLTDNWSLKWMATTTVGKVARWASRLAEYDMTVIFRSGKSNCCADYLTRFIEEEPEEFLPDRAMVWTIASGKLGVTIPSLDEIIGQQQKEYPPEGYNYIKKDGVIYHLTKIWVPPSKRIAVIERFHNLALYYHPGVKKTVSMIRKVFSWSGIQVDVTKYIKSCLECQRLRPGIEKLQGKVNSHLVEGPFDRIFLDVYEFTVDNRRIKVLTIIDSLTRWAEAQLLQKADAQEVAETFLKTWVCRFGCPQVIKTDHATILSGQVMRRLTQIIGTKLEISTVAHPDGNAVVESFHRVIHKGLMRYAMDSIYRQISIDELIQLILYGYRVAFHSSIKDSPAYLTFGIDPRLPIKAYINRKEPDPQARVQLLNTIREAVIQQAYFKSLREKINQPKSRIMVEFRVGQLILLPINRIEAVFHSIQHKGQKLVPKYSMPYRVIKVYNEGRTAQCKALICISLQSKKIREVSIQDARFINPPMTELQIEQWKKILNSYLSEYPIDENVREELFHLFWEEIYNPQIGKDFANQKKERNGQHKRVRQA